MMRLITSLLLLATASAFTTPQTWGAASSVSTAPLTRQFMFSTDDDKKTETITPPPAAALQSVDEPEEVKPEVKPEGSLVKDMNTGKNVSDDAVILFY